MERKYNNTNNEEWRVECLTVVCVLYCAQEPAGVLPFHYLSPRASSSRWLRRIVSCCSSS